MDCKEAQQLITKYISGEINDKDLDKFLEHIQTCKDCYEELEINYTIFSAFMQLDDSPGASYDINTMLQEELNASRKYIKNKKIFDNYKVFFYIAAMIVMTFVLLVQLKLWF
jgi:hypothetical protein